MKRSRLSKPQVSGAQLSASNVKPLAAHLKARIARQACGNL